MGFFWLYSSSLRSLFAFVFFSDEIFFAPLLTNNEFLVDFVIVSEQYSFSSDLLVLGLFVVSDSLSLVILRFFGVFDEVDFLIGDNIGEIESISF